VLRTECNDPCFLPRSYQRRLSGGLTDASSKGSSKAENRTLPQKPKLNDHRGLLGIGGFRILHKGSLLLLLLLGTLEPSNAISYRETFSSYDSASPLVGQGMPAWEAVNDYPSPLLEGDHNDYSVIGVPAAETSQQARAIRQLRSLNINRNQALTLSVELTANSTNVGDFLCFGFGKHGEVPAYLGVQNGYWIIRGSGFGTTHVARHSDGSGIRPVEGDLYRVTSTWRFDGDGEATLNIRNLTAGEIVDTPLFFDAAQSVSSVSLELSRNSPVNTWNSVWLRMATQPEAGSLNQLHEIGMKQNRQPIQRGDVLMRGLGMRPMNAEDPHNTLATAEAFGADNVLWIYDVTDDWIAEARSLSIGVGTAIDQRGWPDIQEIPDFVETFTVRNLNGEQVISTHARENFGPSAWIRHFLPDLNIPGWFPFYRDFVTGLLDQDVVSLHRDDPQAIYQSIRYGASFTDATVAYFRDYLRDNYTEQELASLGVHNADEFNVRDHFLSLGAPTDETLWEWTGSPLMPIFKQALLEATAEFFQQLRSEVETRTGRTIPWSCNGVSPWNAVDKVFDFRLGELQRHLNQPQTLQVIAANADALDKRQGLVTLVDRNWESSATYTADLRLNIATSYALGLVPLVPWDMYMHDAPRYFGSVEDSGDLFHFVSRHRHYFDGYETDSAFGVDMRHGLYSWLPNKEIALPAERSGAAVWVNDENIFAVVRESNDNSAAVVHLVDWNANPGSFDLNLDPQSLVQSDTARLTLLTPGGSPQVWEDYRGGRIVLPTLSPWGLLVAEPVETGAAAPPPSPRISMPARSVVPDGTAIRFADPGDDRIIVYRIGSEAQLASIPFREYHPTNSMPFVEGESLLEAYALDTSTGGESAALRIRLRGYVDSTASPSVLDRNADNALPISGVFQTLAGESRLGESFFGGPLRLMGREVSGGITTRGASALVCAVDPDWRYFAVTVGIDDREERRPSARFQVYFDNELAYETPILNPLKDMIQTAERTSFEISLAIPDGVGEIRLEAVPAGFFPDQNTVIWAEPRAYLSAGPKRTMNEVALPATRPAGAPEYADVSLRYGWVRSSFPTTDDAKEAVRAFHATRVDWFYPGDHYAEGTAVTPQSQAFIDWCHARGMKIGGAMNTNTINPDWRLKNGPASRYIGDPGDPAYLQAALDWGKAQIDAGLDTLVCDDIFFYNASQRQEFNDAVIAPLGDHRTGFAVASNHGGFIDTQYVSAYDFDFHYSDNHFNPSPGEWWDAAGEHRAIDSAIVAHPNVLMPKETRRTQIGLAYANGAHLIAPWDEFISGGSRLFADPVDFADLYGFVRALGQRGALNGYEDAAVGGYDLAETRYGATDPIAVGGGSGALSVFGRARPGEPDAPLVFHLVESGAPTAATLRLLIPALFGTDKVVCQLLTPPAYKATAHESAAVTGNYDPLLQVSTLASRVVGDVLEIDIPAQNSWGVLIVKPSPDLHDLRITPAAATILAGETETFGMTVVDASGVPLAEQPPVVWSVSGGGAIDDSGLFLADHTASVVTVTARAFLDGETVVGSRTIRIENDDFLQGYARWPLNGNALDSVGNRNGTVRGGAPYSVDRREGSNSILLDGNDDFVEIPDHADLDIGTGDFSYACWLKRNANPTENLRLLSKGCENNEQAGYCVFGSDTVLSVALGDGESRRIHDVPHGGVGVWTHLAVTIDRDATMKVYIDGSFESEIDISDWEGRDLSSPRDLRLGRSSSTLFWDGLLDDVRLFHRVLSPSEVSALAIADDKDAPRPDPMAWAEEPSPSGMHSIRMTAVAAIDSSGVQYFFDEISGEPGGYDSGWQDSPIFEPAGMEAGTFYAFRVRARDKTAESNVTRYSATVSTATYATVYSWWIDGFSLPATQRGFGDDPDGDGIGNGVEAAFGTNPSMPDPGIRLVSASPGRLELRRPAGPTAAPGDVLKYYEWSSDLVHWHVADGSDGDGATTLTTDTVAGTQPAKTTRVIVTVHGKQPQVLFLRVRASER